MSVLFFYNSEIFSTYLKIITFFKLIVKYINFPLCVIKYNFRDIKYLPLNLTPIKNYFISPSSN